MQWLRNSTATDAFSRDDTSDRLLSFIDAFCSSSLHSVSFIVFCRICSFITAFFDIIFFLNSFFDICKLSMILFLCGSPPPSLTFHYHKFFQLFITTTTLFTPLFLSTITPHHTTFLYHTITPHRHPRTTPPFWHHTITPHHHPCSTVRQSMSRTPKTSVLLIPISPPSSSSTTLREPIERSPVGVPTSTIPLKLLL